MGDFQTEFHRDSKKISFCLRELLKMANMSLRKNKSFKTLISKIENEFSSAFFIFRVDFAYIYLLQNLSIENVPYGTKLNKYIFDFSF
jgi:hypothetical protein